MDGSGSGKSASYVIPNACQLLGSYVFTDPKGELYEDNYNILIPFETEQLTFEAILKSKYQSVKYYTNDEDENGTQTSNLVICRRNVKVILIYIRTKINFCFWISYF